MHNKPHTEETKRKISLATKGFKSWRDVSGLVRDARFSPYKKGHKFRLGIKHSQEARKKISMTQQGITNEKEWKGYKRSNDYLARRRFQQTIQKQVFERDDYTCQLCKIRGGDLQVDHIQSWSEYVKQRFSVNNCRTLCASCHYKITFGRPMPEYIKGWGHNLLEGRIAK